MSGLWAYLVWLAPVLVIGLVLFMSLYVFRRLRSEHSNKGRWAAAVIVLAIGVFVLFGDVFLGNRQLDAFCKKEAGITVYRVIPLDSSYFDENGNPKYISSYTAFIGDGYGKDKKVVRESLNMEILRPRFKFKNFSESVNNSITKRTQKLVVSSTDEVLGKRVTFLYRGGWLSHIQIGGPIKAMSCSADYAGLNNDLVKKVFSKK